MILYKNSNIKIFDVILNISYQKSFENFIHLFEQSLENSKIFIKIKFSSKEYFNYAGRKYKLSINTLLSNAHYLRQLLGSIAGQESVRYDLIHASGVVFNDKGIIFTGNSGSGKSTLSKLFPKSQILDDDILGITNKNMEIVGRNGSITSEVKKGKKLEYLISDNAIKSYSLNKIFLLDKNYDGGFIKEVSSFIPRNYSNMNTVPKIIQQNYLSKSPILVSSKVYLIGTNGNIKKTKEKIFRTLN